MNEIIFIVFIIFILILFNNQYENFNNIDYNFDVDAVITWVDGHDPTWNKIKNKYANKLNKTIWKSSNTDLRYKHCNELYYCLLSIIKNLPWIRNVFLVTMYPQKPNFIKEFPKVKIIYHHQIFPNLNNLPTFNSQAIETQLYNIPGLSENFLYLNDDFIIAKPLKKSYFFTKTGRIKFYYNQTINKYNLSVMNYLKNNNYNIRYYTPIHHAVALKKSYFKQMWNIFKKDLSITSNNKFRSKNDLWIISLIQQLCGTFYNKCIYIYPKKYDQLYLLLKDKDNKNDKERVNEINKMINIYKYSNPSLLCINNLSYYNKYHQEIYLKIINIFKKKNKL